MNEYSQDIKIICQNHIMKGSMKASEGHPWRNWKIRVVAVDNNRERKGKLNFILDHVEYILHPTFDNPRRVFMKEPYLLQEKGWGEFDMRVVLFFTNNLAEPENIFFDLHFRESTYTISHKIIFNNPSPELIRLLTLDIPSNESLLTHNYNTYDNSVKKRRTSPPLSSSKKVKTPPSISSPAQFSDGPSTPSYYNNRYPTSPSNMLYQHLTDHESASVDSDDLFRAMHGYRQHKRSTQEDGVIIDDIYNEKDLENANPIHTKHIDDHIRSAWGIPKGLDIIELARRLSLRTPEQTEEIESLIMNHRKDDMLLEENEDEFMVDLYSLGPELLNQLWDYTESKMQSQSSLVLSPFSLVQANTNMMMEDDQIL